nr:MAG TPA: hypothetical protein [Caudoviricetes sp.]
MPDKFQTIHSGYFKITRNSLIYQCKRELKIIPFK